MTKHHCAASPLDPCGVHEPSECPNFGKLDVIELDDIELDDIKPLAMITMSADVCMGYRT